MTPQEIEYIAKNFGWGGNIEHLVRSMRFNLLMAKVENNQSLVKLLARDLIVAKTLIGNEGY